MINSNGCGISSRATTVVNRSGLGFDANCEKTKRNANHDFGKSVKNYPNNHRASGNLQKSVIMPLHRWVNLIESRRSDPLFKDIIVNPPKGQSKVSSQVV